MNLRKLALTCTATMLLAGAAAWADNIDFGCPLSRTASCAGSITQSGKDYSTTGIRVFNVIGPYDASVPFELIFNTGTKAISIDGTGIYQGENLMGEITSYNLTQGKTTTDLSFTTIWPTLPSAVQAELGTPTGIDSGFVIALSPIPNAPLTTRHPMCVKAKGGDAQSVDVLITPTPEPGSLVLLGSGLIGLGGFLRRRLQLN